MSNVTHTHIQTHLHPTAENSCFMYKYLHCIPLHLGLISQDWPKPVHFILEDDLNILLSCLYFHSANITDLSHLPGLGSAGTQTQHLMNSKQAVCQLSYISISFNFLSYLAFFFLICFSFQHQSHLWNTDVRVNLSSPTLQATAASGLARCSLEMLLPWAEDGGAVLTRSMAGMQLYSRVCAFLLVH